MKVMFARGSAQTDLDVRADPDATVADLASALSAGVEGMAPDGGLVVDGLYAAPDLTLHEAGVHDGAEVRLPGHQPDVAPIDGERVHVELCVVGGRDAGRSELLTPGSWLLGRGSDCQIRFGDPTVSRQHCRLDVDPGGGVQVTNVSEGVASRLDGQPVRGTVGIDEGAVLELGVVAVTVRRPPADDRPAGVDRFRDLTPTGLLTLNRPPRLLAAPAEVPLVAPVQPAQANKPPFNVASIVAPAAMGLVMVVLMHNVLYAAFAILSPVMMVGNRWETTHRSKRAMRRDTRTFNAALEEFETALAESRRQAIRQRRAGHPDLVEVMRRAELPSVHLWERRAEHPDFLQLSVGLADQAWTPPIDDRRQGLADPVRELVDGQRLLAQVPLEVDLANGGAVGIVGHHELALEVARGLLCQVAVHHGPADVQVAVLTSAEGAAWWDWAKWLPHTRDHGSQGSEHRLLAAGPDVVTSLLDDLVDRRTESSRSRSVAASSGAHGVDDGPTTLFVVDGDELVAGKRSAVRNVLRGAAGPAAGIVVASTPDRLPALCTVILTVDDEGRTSLLYPREGRRHDGLVTAGLSEDRARRCARALAAFEDPEVVDPGASLPEVVHLPTLLGLPRLDAESVAKRWSTAGSGHDLRAPIAMSEDGAFVLDFDRHGPHGLIGGTTGSGKSELLKSLVASLAATYPPSELTFGLFDFKGGATFTDFVDLPHTVGMASDLDVHLARRSLRCLHAELLHREVLFDRAGAKDLASFNERRDRADPAALEIGPIPRLVVIIDEFAALAKELAEEIGALTDLTARGRSLGVHLLLATQKPSSAVNNEIRTNTRLRISLLVEDAQDSVDVIGIPDAARVSHRGRAYCRLGQDDVVPVQTAWSTGPAHEEPLPAVDIDRFVFGGTPRAEGRATPRVAAAEATNLDLLVSAIRGAFEASVEPLPRRPFPDPLPDVLPLDDLLAVHAGSVGPSAAGEDDPAIAGDVTFALADDPARQTRYPIGWPTAHGNLLLYGAVGSGTTTALATVGLACAATRTADEAHLYVLDFGAGDLRPLADLPQCGAVVPAHDTERQLRLIRMLRSEIDKRRALTADERSGLPLVLVLVDNFEGFRSAYETGPAMASFDQFVRSYADGPEVGVVFAVAATRVGGVPSAVASATGNKLLFRLGDPNEYGAFGVPRRELPTFVPGRVVVASSRQVAQVAIAQPDLASAVARIAGRTPPPRVEPRAIGTLATEIGFDAVVGRSSISAERWELAVAVDDEHLDAAALTLYEHEHAVVAGPPRSGRSSALLTIAAAACDADPAVRVLAVALRRSPLRDHPLVHDVVTTADEVGDIIDRLLVASAPHLLLLDDAEGLDDVGGRLAQLIAGGPARVHLAIAGRADTLRGLYGHWTQGVRRARCGVLLQPNLDIDGEILGTPLPRRVGGSFGAGRGFVVGEGRTALAQLALPPPA